MIRHQVNMLYNNDNNVETISVKHPLRIAILCMRNVKAEALETTGINQQLGPTQHLVITFTLTTVGQINTIPDYCIVETIQLLRSIVFVILFEETR